MAASLTTSLSVSLNTLHTASALDFSSVVDNMTKNYALSLASGVAAGQADQVFHDQRTLAASGSEDLDLAGSLVDAFGATLTFVKLKALIVYAASGNTNSVIVSRPASNGVPFTTASATQTVTPGGLYILFDPAGIAVTAGTGDLIHVANSAGTTGVTYDVFIVGTSA